MFAAPNKTKRTQRRLWIVIPRIVIGSRIIGSRVIGRVIIRHCITLCWGRGSGLRPFAITLVPLSSGESLTGKKGNDNDKCGENSGELHCVGW